MRAALTALGCAAIVAAGIVVAVGVGADRIGDRLYGNPRLP